MKPALTGVGAAQGQKRKKPASITCGLDVDCGGNSGRGSSPTQKARHSLERGHVDLIFSHATQRKLGKTYADAV